MAHVHAHAYQDEGGFDDVYYEYDGDDIVLDYGEGRVSVEDFLQVCRSYRGHAPHFLLSEHYAYGYDRDDDDNNPRRWYYSIYVCPGPVFFHCMKVFSEEQLVELLEAVAAEWPQVHTLSDDWYSLVHLALKHTASRRVHLMLAIPGATRLLDRGDLTPLHAACRSREVDPMVIHRLIDLDPDVLTIYSGENDGEKTVPLHDALERDPSSTHAQRMIELRPETLYFRDNVGRTPVMCAMEGEMNAAPDAEMRPEWATALQQIVARYPRTISLPETAFMGFHPLESVCGHRASRYPELVKTVVEAGAPSLVVPMGVGRYTRRRRTRCLPFDEAAHSGLDEELALFVMEGTEHMAISVIEYVLFISGDLTEAFDSNKTAANVAWFQDHVKDTLTELFPEIELGEKNSGLSVAQALLHRGVDNDNNENGSTLTPLLTALFCHEATVDLLWDESFLLRDVILCDTVLDLYRLNRRGRYRPIGEATHGNDDLAAAAALHQVELLASLRDSFSLDSTYLQFRHVSRHSLLVHGRGSGGEVSG